MTKGEIASFDGTIASDIPITSIDLTDNSTIIGLSME